MANLKSSAQQLHSCISYSTGRDSSEMSKRLKIFRLLSCLAKASNRMFFPGERKVEFRRFFSEMQLHPLQVNKFSL